jgi:GTPase SAR1 family protein
MSVAGSQAVGHAGPSSVAGATAAGDGHGPSPRLPQMAPLSKYKVVFLGDQGTGKTSIIKAFIHGSFDQNYQVRVREYARAVGKAVACAGAAIGRHPLITLDSTGLPAETAAAPVVDTRDGTGAAASARVADAAEGRGLVSAPRDTSVSY